MSSKIYIDMKWDVFGREKEGVEVWRAKQYGDGIF